MDPQESKKLSFDEKCAWSPLLTQLWATVALGSLSGEELPEPSSSWSSWASVCLSVCLSGVCCGANLGTSASGMVA